MGTNIPIKRHRVAEWIKEKKDPYICYLQVTHFRSKSTLRLKVSSGNRYCTQMETKRKLYTYIRQHRL